MTKRKKPKGFSYGKVGHDFGLHDPSKNRKPEPKREKLPSMLPRTRGRFDGETRDKLIQAARFGLDDRGAASAAGISLRTLRSWKRQGQADLADGVESEHAQFAAEFERARTETKTKVAASILSHARTDWRAGYAWLRAHDPERWDRDATERVAELVLNRIFERIDEAATPEEAARFRELLSGSIDVKELKK